MPHRCVALSRRYDRWLEHVSATRGYEPPRIFLGDPKEDPTTLSRQDWRGPRAGWTEDDVLGYWEVDVRRAGTYRMTVHTKPLDQATTVHVRVNNAEGTATLGAGATKVSLAPISVPTGAGRLEAWLDLGAQTRGVWYVDVEYTS